MQCRVRVRSIATAEWDRRKLHPLGLVAPRRKVGTSGQQNSRKGPPAVLSICWIVVIMPPPPSLPDPMAVTDSPAGYFARPSEAACVLRLANADTGTASS